MSEELEPLSFRYQKALAPLVQLSKDASVSKRLSELLTLLDFSTTLNRSMELSEILDVVLFAVMGETRADWAAIALRQEDGSMQFVAGRGASAPERGKSFKADGADVFSAAVSATDGRLADHFRKRLFQF